MGKGKQTGWYQNIGGPHNRGRGARTIACNEVCQPTWEELESFPEKWQPAPPPTKPGEPKDEEHAKELEVASKTPDVEQYRIGESNYYEIPGVEEKVHGKKKALEALLSASIN